MSVESKKETQQPLMSDFAPHSKEEWRDAVDKLLKGKSYEKIMLTKTYENITLDPIYRKDDWEKLDHISELPGSGNKIRHNDVNGYQNNPWQIAQEIAYPTTEECNQALLNDLNRGQNAINLVLDEATKSGLDPDQANEQQVGRNGVSIASLQDIEDLFKNISQEAIDIQIQAHSIALPICSLVAAHLRNQNVEMKNIHGCVGMDPLSELAKDGSICLSLEQAFKEMFYLTKWAAKNSPQMRTIVIDTIPYHEAGASAVEEIAISLSTAITYIREMLQKGIHINVIAKHIQFNFAIGSNFFMEIAKFRAARMVWAKVLEEFGAKEDAQKMYIHAKTSSFNKSQTDIYVNMLRTTTEAFSAVMGSVDSIHVSSFDEIVRKPSEFSRRISRNQQLILKEECHFDHVTDPAGGSWYIESLTSLLADKIWVTFQKIEEDGGMLNALQNNTIQNMLAEIAETRKANIAKRKDVFVGVNMYANPLEKGIEQSEDEYAETVNDRMEKIVNLRKDIEIHINYENVFASLIKAFQNGATLGQVVDVLRAEEDEWPHIEAIKQFRITEMFEELRANINHFIKKGNDKPEILLVKFGNLKQYKARTDFSRGFFEVGAFDVKESEVFTNPQVAAQKIVEQKDKIVVLCSSDDAYPEIVPSFLEQFNESNKPIIVLAGYPKDHIENFKKAGIDYFIHLRANAYDILSSIQKSIGVIS